LYLFFAGQSDQVRSIAVVTTAVARGDLTQEIEIQVEGEMSTLKGVFSFCFRVVVITTSNHILMIV